MDILLQHFNIVLFLEADTLYIDIIDRLEIDNGSGVTSYKPCGDIDFITKSNKTLQMFES